jgi:hypothetical protein
MKKYILLLFLSSYISADREREWFVFHMGFHSSTEYSAFNAAHSLSGEKGFYFTADSAKLWMAFGLSTTVILSALLICNILEKAPCDK